MPSPFDRRAKLFVALLATSIVVGLAGFRAADLRSRRDWTLRVADSRLRNLAFILSEYLRGAFAASDAAMRQMALQSQRIGGPAAAASDWTAILTTARAGLSGIGSFAVVDADGIVRHSTAPLIVGQSRRSEYVFERLSRPGPDELVVSTPLLSFNEPRQFLIPIGRRLKKADGTFDGVIVATFVPEELRDFFRTIDVGTHGIVWVFHPNGFVLFREPSPASPTGQPAAGNPLFEAARERVSGTIEGPIEPGGGVFISAFHQMSAPPLITAVSRDRHELLADWWWDVQVSAVLFLLFGVTTAVGVFLLFRQIDARAKAEHALVLAGRDEATKLQDAHDRLEAALEAERRARRESDRANYLKDEFLMTVSHELRTPMTAIFGWARLLAEGKVDEVQRLRAIQTIERNAQTQARLIDDLLDVSRVVTGKLRLDVRPVHVEQLIDAAIDGLKPAADARGLRVEATIDPAVGAISADPQRLQQIVWNLLSNAIKFTPTGGRVAIRARRDREHVEVTVSDTGAGISAEFLPYVFERFRQEDTGSRRRYGGMGLGLTIVRHLVELHGGSVEAESAGPGRGATFVVRLPIRSAVNSTTGDGDGLAAAAREAAPRRLDGVSVLVVDDDPEARELFGAILTAAGATVRTVASALDALAALGETTFQVMVADIEMPGEDGYELVERARALADGRLRMSTIAVTAYTSIKDCDRAARAGFDRHVAKPVDPDDFIEAVVSLSSAPG